MGDWGLGIGPTPQYPIPNPPIPNPHELIKNIIIKFYEIKNKLFLNI
jgi:hypothetical protein